MPAHCTWNYYNDNNPAACAALEQLIRERIIPPGAVDSRSIKEVQAHELREFTQWHFFAGGGLWAAAARLAGWPDSRPLVTASCPCQPFSDAGQRRGTDDPRHLWPDLFRILGAARDGGFCPPIIMGEQVAKKAGRNWFDGVRADLARIQIVARAVDIPACAVDAPHERNRLYWVAHAMANTQCARGQMAVSGPGESGGTNRQRTTGELRGSNGGVDSGYGHMANADNGRCEIPSLSIRREGQDGVNHTVACGNDGPDSITSFRLVDAERIGRGEGRTKPTIFSGRAAATGANVRPNGSWWADAEWLLCHDGKARRAKPEIPMLVNGMAGRTHLWSLAGNSIVPVLAAEVIRAFLDAECDIAATVPA